MAANIAIQKSKHVELYRKQHDSTVNFRENMQIVIQVGIAYNIDHTNTAG